MTLSQGSGAAAGIPSRDVAGVKKTLFKPGAESAGMAAEEIGRPKATKRGGQSRQHAASTILQAAKWLNVKVEPCELSSWAKIVHWLWAKNDVPFVAMFGTLTVPHHTWEVMPNAWSKDDAHGARNGRRPSLTSDL